MRRLSFIIFTLLATLTAFAQSVTMKVGGESTSYSSLAAAVTAANAKASGVVPVLVLQDNGTGLNSMTVTHDMVIDLNGFTGTLTTSKLNIITIDNNARLTITDGSANANGSLTLRTTRIKSGTTAITGIDVLSGTFVLDKGTVKTEYAGSTSEPITYGVKLTDANCAFEMNGGTIETSSDYIAYGIFDNGTATINNGIVKLNSENVRIYIDQQSYAVNVTKTGKLTINDGIFAHRNTTGMHADINNAGTASNVKINGGCFTHEGYLAKYNTKGTYTLIPSYEESYKLGCRLKISTQPGDFGTALNITQWKTYTTLEQALSEAKAGDTISLMADYTLSNDATVPAGVTLLIPFDRINSCFTTNPESLYENMGTKQSAFRTLTIAENKKLTVLGKLSVSARIKSAMGASYKICGSVVSTHGLIRLSSNASIDVKGGLYCWGYICGNGNVTVENGAEIYESLQIGDWRGGTVASMLYEVQTYPFNDYYVQNVESPLTLKPGSRMMVTSDIEAEGNKNRLDVFPFMSTASDAMYRLGSNTSVTLTYDGTTDRMQYDFDGNVTMSGIKISMDGASIDANCCRFPIPAYLTINQKKGQFALPHNYIMCAGSQLNIGKDASLYIPQGDTLFVFKKSEWSLWNGRYRMPLVYTMANGINNRQIMWSSNTVGNDEASYAKITDATINIDGDAIINGDIMTSTDNGSTPSTIHMYYSYIKDSAPTPVQFYNMFDVNADSRISMQDANIFLNRNEYKSAKITTSKYLRDAAKSNM